MRELWFLPKVCGQSQPAFSPESGVRVEEGSGVGLGFEEQVDLDLGIPVDPYIRELV